MSKAKRRSAKAKQSRKNTEAGVIAAFIPVKTEDKQFTEKAAMITALLNEADVKLGKSQYAPGAGITVIDYPKSFFVNLFEKNLMSLLPDDEEVQSDLTDIAENIRESNTVIVRLHK